MMSYLISVLSVFGTVSTPAINTIVVVVPRAVVRSVEGRLFGMGGRRSGGNSSAETFAVGGVSVTLRYT